MYFLVQEFILLHKNVNLVENNGCMNLIFSVANEDRFF
jgi:hypothetical protein